MRLVASQDIGQRTHLTSSGGQGAPGIPEKWRCLYLLSCIFSLIIQTFIFQLKQWLDVAASCCTPGLWGKNLVQTVQKRLLALCGEEEGSEAELEAWRGERDWPGEWMKHQEPRVHERGESSENSCNKATYEQNKTKKQGTLLSKHWQFPKRTQTFFFFNWSGICLTEQFPLEIKFFKHWVTK